MNFLRSYYLRRLMVMIFILTSLITQIHLVYSCELMLDGPKTTCCCDDHTDPACPMEGDYEHDQPYSPTNCCKVSANLGTSHSIAIVDIGHDTNADAAISSQLQPAFLHSYYENITPAEKNDVFIYGIHNSPWLFGSDTYRLTLRIRE